MRRVVILALLVGAVRLIVPFGSAGAGSETLLAFGFLIVAAYTIGEVTATVGLPKVVGYVFAGVLFGPSVLGAVSAASVHGLAPIGGLAVSLIAFLAGSELRWSEVRARGVVLLKLMAAELGCSFAALAAVLLALHRVAPFLRPLSDVEMLAFALLFASIAIVHSPSVTMAVLSETRADGLVARTTLGVVLLADVAVVLVFSGAAAVARVLVPVAAGEGLGIAALIWEIGGALAVGALLGLGVVLYLRFVARELFLFAILAVFLGAEIARLAHVETLLALLTAGFVTENLARPERGGALRDAMERSAAPVFVVFFALAGAEIDVDAVAAVIVLVVPIALVRVGAIRLGIRLGAAWAGPRLGAERRLVWMGLVSQAGVAIGLAAIVADSFPRLGPPLRTLLLALVAVNESVGAVLFRRALVAAGEAAPATAPEEVPEEAGSR